MSVYHMLFRGDFACWNHPAYRAERISLPVGSHDAWVGVMRGILGHWSLDWHIPEVRILRELSRISITTNERKFGAREPFDASSFERERTQRTTSYLRNLEYEVVAQMRLNHNAGPDDNLHKFQNMFESRVENDQQRRPICFGVSECGNVEYKRIHPKSKRRSPVNLTQSLGYMYYGRDRTDPDEPRYFYPLTIVNGVCRYPDWDEVRRNGISRSSRGLG